MVRDVRTLTELKVRALVAVTAVTAQTDAALLASHVVPESLLRTQIAAAFATVAVQAVKIGMLASGTSVRAVTECLAAHAQVPMVLDPVLVSSSGGSLLDLEGRERLVAQLLPLATVITPNLPEAALLLGVPQARDEFTALEQAQELLRRGARAVLLKGGHASGPRQRRPAARPRRAARAAARAARSGRTCAAAAVRSPRRSPPTSRRGCRCPRPARAPRTT